MKHVIATVHIVIPLSDEDDVTQPGYIDDAVSEFLTGNLEHNNLILDWGYTHTHDNVIADFENDYDEGDFINLIKTKLNKS